MKFEEALKLLREGKKITHPSFDDDVYFQGCYYGLRFYPEENLDVKKSRGMSIVKMKGDNQHPDMGARSWDEVIKNLDERCKHGIHPQLNLYLVMSEDWTVKGEIQKNE